MRRHSAIMPGYDCRTECKHEKKGEHGIHGDEWHYAVIVDLIALSLTVYTDIFPPTVARWNADLPIEERRHGADLTFHVGFPTNREEMRDYNPTVWGKACLHVGRCDDSSTTALGADKFFRDHGDPRQFEQAEGFWKALEAHLQEREEGIRNARVDLDWHRCNGCDGVGVVRR